jgi:hypothetical protein
MTAAPESSPLSEPRLRVRLLIWVALGVVAMLALASLVMMTHKPGVPTLAPGVKGTPHASSGSVYEAARKSGPR